MPQASRSRRSARHATRSERLGLAGTRPQDSAEAVELAELIQRLDIDGITENPFEETQADVTPTDAPRHSTRRSSHSSETMPNVCIRGHLRENERARAPSPEVLRKARPYDRPAPAHTHSLIGGRLPRFKKLLPQVGAEQTPKYVEDNSSARSESPHVPEPPYWNDRFLAPVPNPIEAITMALDNVRLGYTPVAPPSPVTPPSTSQYSNEYGYATVEPESVIPSSPTSDYSDDSQPAAPAAEEALEGAYDMSPLGQALQACIHPQECDSSPEIELFQPGVPWQRQFNRGRTWNGGDPSLSPYAAAPPESYGRVRKEKKIKKGGIPYSSDKAARVKSRSVTDSEKKKRVRIEDTRWMPPPSHYFPKACPPSIYQPFLPIGVTAYFEAEPTGGFDYNEFGDLVYDPNSPHNQYPHRGF